MIFTRKQRIVRINSGNPDYPLSMPGKTDRFQGYEYSWNLDDEPQIGQWVVLQGEGRQTWIGGIVAVDRISKADAATLKRVIRIATDRDLAAERRRRARH